MVRRNFTFAPHSHKITIAERHVTLFSKLLASHGVRIEIFEIIDLFETKAYRKTERERKIE